MEGKLNEEEAARQLRERELQGGLEFDGSKLESKAPEAPESLGKATQYFENQGTRGIPGGDMGWKPVPVENLPSNGLFYPQGSTLEIKPASVGEIRHFSTIDEQDPLGLDDKLNIIMDKCVRLKFPDRAASWRDLKEEDRFYLIFAVRGITFKNGENKLHVNVKCGATCLGDGTFAEKIELCKENFDYYKIDPKLMNKFDEVERCFVINHEQVGNLKLYVPSLGVMSFIKGWLKEKISERAHYDQTFIKVAPFLFDDWRTLDKNTFNRAQNESLSWSINKLSAVLKLVEKIRFGAKTELKRKCDQCGAEVAAPLSFPGGVKSIFLPADTLDDILG